jgi:hypothetical protein
MTFTVRKHEQRHRRFSSAMAEYVNASTELPSLLFTCLHFSHAWIEHPTTFRQMHARHTQNNRIQEAR